MPNRRASSEGGEERRRRKGGGARKVVWMFKKKSREKGRPTISRGQEPGLEKKHTTKLLK
jgi:hypothetical protein